MIPVVTDSAIAALPENLASDASRRVAPSVDRFSEHLHKSKPSKSKQAPVHEKRSSPEPSAPFRAQAKQESGHRDQKVAQKPKEVNAQERDLETEEDAGEEATETQEAVVLGNGVSPVAILPVAEANLETQVEVDAIYECGFFVRKMGTPQENAGANQVKVGGDSATEAAALNPGATPPVDLELPVEEAHPAALLEETSFEPAHSIAGWSGDTAGEAIAAPGEPLPTATSPAAADTNTGLQGATLSAVVGTDAEATGDPSEVRNDKPSKNGATSTFSHYLFGEGMTRIAVAPVPDANSGVVAELPMEKVAGERAESDEEKAVGKETTTGQAHSSPLLTPADVAQAAASTLPLSLKRHLEAQSAGAKGAPSAPVINDTQHARLLQRVSRAFRAAEERGGEIQIRLSPPELGSMKLELSLASGVLTAKLEVETQRAQTILLESLPALRERLAEQGIRVEQFDVNLPQRDSDGQQPQQQQQQQSQMERQARAAAGPSRQAREAAAMETRGAQRLPADVSRLNVIV